MQSIGFIYVLIAQIIFFLFTIVFILWFIKNRKEDDSLDLLKKRLILGEINKKEYDSLFNIIGEKNEKD